MRNIITVIDQISAILEPVTQTELNNPAVAIVKAELASIRKQAVFYPPESQLTLWTQLGAVLYRQFGSFNPMPTWATAVSKVVTGS